MSRTPSSDSARLIEARPYCCGFERDDSRAHSFNILSCCTGSLNVVSRLLCWWPCLTVPAALFYRAPCPYGQGNGISSLMYAAVYGRLDAIVALVDAGADLGMKSKTQVTGVWTYFHCFTIFTLAQTILQ